MAKEVGVSRPSVTKAIKRFVEWGLVNARNKKNTYYSINRESHIVKNILQLDNLLIEKMLGEDTLYEIYDYLESKKTSVKSDVMLISAEKDSNPLERLNTIYTIPKPRIWWENQSFNNVIPCYDGTKLNYLSGVTT